MCCQRACSVFYNIFPRQAAEKAKATIKELNLNCRRLCQVRKRILKKLDADYRKLRANLENTTFTQIDALLNQMTAQSLVVKPDGSLPAFFTTMNVASSVTSFRAFFGSRAEAFLDHNGSY